MGFSLRLAGLSVSAVRPYILVAAVVALFLAVTEIFEFVELPFEALVGHLFTSGSVISVALVTSSMTSFGYAGLFFLMLLESASLPVPSEVILPFAGYLVYTGRMSFEGALLVGTVAGVAGALVDYYLALKLGRPAVQRVFRWAGIKAEHLDRAERWLDSRGAWSILVSRFIPGLRSAISLPAGALRMRLWTFAAMTAIGALGWSALLVYLGYSAGGLWQSALSSSAPLLTNITLAGVAVASGSYILYYFSHRSKA